MLLGPCGGAERRRARRRRTSAERAGRRSARARALRARRASVPARLDDSGGGSRLCATFAIANAPCRSPSTSLPGASDDDVANLRDLLRLAGFFAASSGSPAALGHCGGPVRNRSARARPHACRAPTIRWRTTVVSEPLRNRYAAPRRDGSPAAMSGQLRDEEGAVAAWERAAVRRQSSSRGDWLSGPRFGAARESPALHTRAIERRRGKGRGRAEGERGRRS